VIELKLVQCLYYVLHECMQLWGKTEQLHIQNMEQLHGYDLRNVQMFVQGQKPLGKRLVNKKICDR